MDLTLLSGDVALIARLHVDAAGRFSRERGSEDGIAAQVGPPQRVPGATASWWEFAVDFGLIAAPASVMCGVIANWLWSAWKSAATASREASPVKVVGPVNVILRDGDRVAEVLIEAGDIDAVRSALQTALLHVHPE